MLEASDADDGLYKALQDREPTRVIPVIIVSAYALLLLDGAPREADEVLQKPFDLADLLARVRDAAIV